ncbi:hypothetical protein [Geminicoccus roseus]|uniref:hypothetical protein n=1 Tax=Geminicoccus roseus TaxID=404900 RepID=UPI0004294B0B|nr:hypothetical protein [Geminicoccus roseus]
MPAVEAEIGLDLLPVSPAGAVVYAGPSFFLELERLHGRSILMDCGGQAGDVLACLRTGLRDLLFTGAMEMADRLEVIAVQQRAALRRSLDLPLLELGVDDDLGHACRIRGYAAPRGITPV